MKEPKIQCKQKTQLNHITQLKTPIVNKTKTILSRKTK